MNPLCPGWDNRLATVEEAYISLNWLGKGGLDKFAWTIDGRTKDIVPFLDLIINFIKSKTKMFLFTRYY